MAGREDLKVEDVLNAELHPDERVIRDFNVLQLLVTALRDAGQRIVLTQGVWDLIHEGHAKYLEKAKAQGDVLIVGVDSDALTKQRKGPSRPIVPEAERLRMISHLRHVDLLTVRNVGEEIGALIRMIKPDVLVVSKSTKDFSDKLKQEYAPVCGEIVNLEPQAMTSTSERIRRLTIDGAQQLATEIQKLTDDFINKIKNQ